MAMAMMLMIIDSLPDFAEPFAFIIISLFTWTGLNGLLTKIIMINNVIMTIMMTIIMMINLLDESVPMIE